MVAVFSPSGLSQLISTIGQHLSFCELAAFSVLCNVLVLVPLAKNENALNRGRQLYVCIVR